MVAFRGWNVGKGAGRRVNRGDGLEGGRDTWMFRAGRASARFQFVKSSLLCHIKEACFFALPDYSYLGGFGALLYINSLIAAGGFLSSTH